MNQLSVQEIKKKLEIFSEANNINEIIGCYQELARRNPFNLYYRYQEAYFINIRPNVSEEISRAQCLTKILKILEDFPFLNLPPYKKEHVGIYMRLGENYFYLGQRQQGFKYLNIVGELTNSADIYFNIAKEHYADSNNPDYLASLSKAMSLDPEKYKTQVNIDLAIKVLKSEDAKGQSYQERNHQLKSVSEYQGYYFNGSRYLQVPYSTNFNLGASGTDWTVECFFQMPIINTKSMGLMGMSSGGGTLPKWMLGINFSNIWAFTADTILFYSYNNESSKSINVSHTWTVGQWYHVALVYTHSNTVINLFVNGRNVGSLQENVSNITGNFNIGADGEAVHFFTGNISNVKITNGEAKYTDSKINLPPPPLTTLANTILLTCQSNNPVDNSTYNHKLTVNDVSITEPIGTTLKLSEFDDINIVQIGTNQANDEVTSLINEYSSYLNKFIAVEPLLIHHPSIKECYKNIDQLVIEGVAITPSPSTAKISFYYHKEDIGGALSSTSKEHILKHRFVSNPKLTEEGIVELQVDQLTLNQLFEKHHLIDITVLYIDAEGLDLKLIQSIDFDKYNINNIIYERIHLVDNGEEAIKFLESKGYRTIRNVGQDRYSHAAVKKNNKSEMIKEIVQSDLKVLNQRFQKNIASWKQFIAKEDPRKILVVGAPEGESICYLIEKLTNNATLEIHCIDSWDSGVNHRTRNIDMAVLESNFDYNIKLTSTNKKNLKIYKHKGFPAFLLHKMSSIGLRNYFDFIYIDSSHDAPDVLSDIVTAFHLLKVGGVSGIDYCLPQLNNDPLEIPKLAIEAFTNLYMKKIAIISGINNHQLFFRKTSN
jgi:FkbM family methyltransferase